jgi:UDP-N-acetylbacillosamine transaminase
MNIPFHKYISEFKEHSNVSDVLDGENINQVELLEKEFATYIEASYAVATTSGTSALHLALRVLGVKDGDFVLASSFTFIGSISAIHYQNATPIFVDSDSSWNISPKLLKDAIRTAPKKPKALIITHLYGQLCKMDEIVAICKEEGIFLLEDAAESLGASYNGKQSGTMGDMGIYSFNGNKILTTSGGGMLISKNSEYIQKAKFLSTQAKEDFLHYEHKEFGYNYRMSNILAAVGVAQMEVLKQRVNRRREIFELYKKELSNIDEINFMPEIKNSIGNRWLTTLTLNHTNPHTLIEALQKENIESRPLWKPMHLQPLFKDALVTQDGTSQKLFESGICLPSGSSMSYDDVLRVCSTIKKVLK